MDNRDQTSGPIADFAAPARAEACENGASLRKPVQQLRRRGVALFPELGRRTAFTGVLLRMAALAGSLLLVAVPFSSLGDELAGKNPILAAAKVRTANPDPTLSLQVSASSDDANQDGSTLVLRGATDWLGNGASTTSSYAGLRFTQVTIPPGATVTSARLQVYASQTQWIRLNMSIAAEATGNSPTFSSSDLPSQRTLTAQNVASRSNTQWNANTWYTLDQMAPVLQEIVNRGDWLSGNSLSIILKGTGSAWARKMVTSFDGSAALAPKLLVSYVTFGRSTAGAPPTVTPSLTATPSPTATGTATATPTGPATATLTSTATASPTSTTTATSTSIVTATSTPTPAPTAVFPATGVLDNFDRANGTIGANWSESAGDYSLVNNQLSVGSGQDIYWNPASFGATQEAYVTLVNIKQTSTEIDLLLKSQSNTGSGNGVLEVSYDPVNKLVRVWTYTSAQGWVQHGADIPVTFVNGDQFGARATSTGSVQVYQNGHLVATRIVTAWPYYSSSGYIALWFINSTGTVLDDFGGGTTAAEPTPTAAATPTTTPASTSTLIETLTLTVPPTATPTMTLPPNTATSTVTPTPTIAAATATATNAPSTTPAPAAPVFFAVAPGSSDVIPHQIIRTKDDRLYLMAGLEYSTVIYAYWTAAPGLPANAAAFTGVAHVTASGDPIALDAVYDGNTIVHVIVLLNSGSSAGSVIDYPFDTALNTFKPAITLATTGHTVSGDYVGSSGISGMMDETGALQVAYWSSSNHMVQQAFTYNSAANTLTAAGAAQQVDTLGSANHPAEAISPADGSLTIAWVSQATSPARILARSRTSAGVWGSVETVSAAPAWTSPYFGVNIDQGPSLLIGADGTKHLTYIENWDATGYYGHVHYVSNSGSGWIDQALSSYSHDPALALNSSGGLYIIGHGHPQSQTTDSNCKTTNNMCMIKRNSDGSWGMQQLFAAAVSPYSFDSSPSVKWSVVGLNRPESVEFAFFAINNGDYNHATLYYGRLATP